MDERFDYACITGIARKGRIWFASSGNFYALCCHHFDRVWIGFDHYFLFFVFLSSHLWPMDLIITILPVVRKDLSISPRFTPYNFLSRCKFSTLTTRQPMVEFYLLAFPRFPLRKKEHNGKSLSWMGLAREWWCCTMGLVSRLDMNTCETSINTNILLLHY